MEKKIFEVIKKPIPQRVLQWEGLNMLNVLKKFAGSDFEKVFTIGTDQELYIRTLESRGEAGLLHVSKGDYIFCDKVDGEFWPVNQQ